MSAATTSRYPFAALAAAMNLTPYLAAKELGIVGKDEQEYRRRGVTARVGDRLAVKAGLDPYAVWPKMLDDAIADAEAADAEAAAKRRKQRSDWFREKRRRDPAFRESELERARRYREDVGREAMAAAERRRYAANREEILARQRARRAAKRAA